MFDMIYLVIGDDDMDKRWELNTNILGEGELVEGNETKEALHSRGAELPFLSRQNCPTDKNKGKNHER